jgi:TonB family protein
VAAQRSVGPLFFDPQGADFERWLKMFKREVYRNWRIPDAQGPEVQGHVDLEFTVERDGSVSAVEVLKSCGSSEGDRTAESALLRSRFPPLPKAFPERRVIMSIAFSYGG